MNSQGPGLRGEERVAEMWIFSCTNASTSVYSVGALYGFVEVEMLKFVYDCFITEGWEAIISTAIGVLEVLENTIVPEGDKGSIEEILRAPLNELLWSDADFRAIINKRISGL